MAGFQPFSFRVHGNMSAAKARCLSDGQIAFYSASSPDRPERNEDAAIVVAGHGWTVVAVSDGAGGAAGGARASDRTVEILRRRLRTATNESRRAAVLDAIETANAAVRDEVPGAMATIAVWLLEDRTARPISVGDSVCSILGGRGKWKYRSVAHGPTGFGEEAGLLDEHESLTHRERHLVSNMLGLPTMRVEVGIPLGLAIRDTVLVASDGLFDNVTADEIAGLARVRPLVRAVDLLAERARSRMNAGEPPCHADDLTILASRLA